MRGDRLFFELIMPVACGVTVFVLAFFLSVSFLSAIMRALRRVSPENRLMEPGQVWLNLIPIFNIVWVTVTVERVAESLRNEFRARGLDRPGEPYGRVTGLAMVAFLVPGVWFYPAFVCFPVAFCFWVAYWRQINRYTHRLKSNEYAPPPTDEGW